MECSCHVDCYVDNEEDEDGYEEISSKRRLDTVKRKCFECKTWIKPGVEFRHSIYKHKVKRFNYRICTDCISLLNVFFDDWYFGKVWDMIEEMIDENEGQISESCISRFTQGAREFVCDAIERTWNVKPNGQDGRVKK